jgi:hypothetical protein
MARGRKTGGRQKGTPNKITRAFRDAVQRIYKGIGGDKHSRDWAKDNPTEFCKIAARQGVLQVGQTASQRTSNVIGLPCCG